MKALVTGAAGFVGSSLADRLLAGGHHVVGIDSITEYYDPVLKRDNLRRLSGPNFEFHEADLVTEGLVDLLENVTHIFHQAGQPGVRKSWGADFATYVDSNVLATQRLLEFAKECETLERFVYASSSSVYGQAERYPTTELDLPRPFSPYGVTKLAAEHLCSLYAQNFGVPTVSLRYFTVYGPRQRPDMAFTRFCLSAISGGAIQIFGDGEQIRDFTYIDDVVEANMLAASTNTSPGSVFNVSGGSSVSVNRIVNILSGIHGEQVQVRNLPAVVGDVRRTGGSARLAQDHLGWTPATAIEDGLAAQYKWARASCKGSEVGY